MFAIADIEYITNVTLHYTVAHKSVDVYALQTFKVIWAILISLHEIFAHH